jgi:pimeloyl-ACP methyl ester carboxylesterase
MWRPACVAFGAAMLLLSACISVPVNERVFFYPPKVEQKATDASQMRLRKQEYITGPFADEHYLDGRVPYIADRLPATVTHEFVTLGKERIAITRIKAANAEAREPLIVHCGGNATDRFWAGGWYSDKVLPWGEPLIFDYPGYGDSTGRPTVQAFDRVIDAMGPWLDEQAKGRPLVMWGHSIGGLICARLASVSREVDAVILETTATSPTTMAKSKVAWIPFIQVKVEGGFETYDVPRLLEGFEGPVMVVGAGADRTLPADLSRSLSKALTNEGLNVTYLEYADAGHMDAAITWAFASDAKVFFAQVSDGPHKSPSRRQPGLNTASIGALKGDGSAH